LFSGSALGRSALLLKYACLDNDYSAFSLSVVRGSQHMPVIVS
jgi:hypothetical protein